MILWALELPYRSFRLRVVRERGSLLKEGAAKEKQASRLSSYCIVSAALHFSPTVHSLGTQASLLVVSVERQVTW